MAGVRVFLPRWLGEYRVKVVTKDPTDATKSFVEIIDTRAKEAFGERLSVRTDVLVMTPDDDIDEPHVPWPHEVRTGEARLNLNAIRHHETQQIMIEVAVVEKPNTDTASRARVLLTTDEFKDLVRSGWQFLHSEVFGSAGGV